MKQISDRSLTYFEELKIELKSLLRNCMRSPQLMVKHLGQTRFHHQRCLLLSTPGSWKIFHNCYECLHHFALNRNSLLENQVFLTLLKQSFLFFKYTPNYPLGLLFLKNNAKLYQLSSLIELEMLRNWEIWAHLEMTIPYS